MTWGRLDDQANTNSKLLALSDAAWRMWGCGLIYCQANLTDGFIPDHAILTFGVRAKNKKPVIDELCSVLAIGKGPCWHRVEGGYQVHDFLDWNDSREDVLTGRAKSQDRLKRWKERHKNGAGNAFQTAHEHASTTTTTSTEKKTKSVSSAPQDGAEPEAGVLDFPTVGASTSWPLTQTQVDEWAQLYPHTDVLAESRKALAWVKASPERRKTAKGMARFLVGWLARTVDSGRRQTPTAAPQEPSGIADWQSECRRLHGRRCNGRVGHANQMAIDAEKAQAHA